MVIVAAIGYLFLFSIFLSLRLFVTCDASSV